MSIEQLTWSPHPKITELSRAWYKGCSIICDSSLDRKYVGALYEIQARFGQTVVREGVFKANSLEEADKIINTIYEG